MRRICFVIPSLSVGGTERQLVHLVRSLVNDHDVMLLCTHHDGALAGDARRSGAQVRVLGPHSGWDFRQHNALRRLFRGWRPDIVHSFLFGFDLWASHAARAAGVPVVLSSRRQLATWKKGRHVLMQRLANRYVDCVVANSQAVADYAIAQEHANPDLFRVIRNGIDADAFMSPMDARTVRVRYRVPFHRHVIGMVANFSPVKDHEMFVETAVELRRRRADVHFLLVGRGPLLEEVEAHIARRDMRDSFTHVTTVAEMADVYRLMDVSVLCSKVEGLPNVIMESMATGTPVVAPAVGGIPELIRHGDTGRLVESRRPEEFADAIEWVLDHPEERELMVARAAAFVRNELSIAKMVESYRALYDELLARVARGSRKPGRA